MLNTVLEKIGKLFSKSFLIGTFYPILAFAFVNSILLYYISDECYGWACGFVELEEFPQAFFGLTILIGLAMVAYLFSTVKLFLRELLEGDHWPEWSRIRTTLTKSQNARRNKIDQDMQGVRETRRQLRRKKAVWQEQLLKARRIGRKKARSNFTELRGKARGAMERLRKAEETGTLPRPEDVSRVVAQLKVELSKANADNSSYLDKTQYELVVLLERATDMCDHEYIRLFNEKQFNFGTKIAPTTMGNIAGTVQSYAESRYSLNLATFWSRLEKVLRDDKYYAVLQEAKTQLDFLVALFWLTVLTTLIWVPVLVWLSYSLVPFFLVGIGGPLLAILWHKLAAQNYRAYADILRSTVDLYRFDLLEALHILPPNGIQKEREFWKTLDRISSYGGDVEVRYKHPESSP